MVAQGLVKTSCALHALSILANHVHMLVTPAEADALPAFVKCVAQRYAQYRNLNRGGTGKLFEQRYICRVVDSETYLAYVTAYIDLNPFASGLISLRDRPYPYTTHHLHAGRLAAGAISRRIWSPSKWYIGLGKTSAERAAGYEEALRQFASTGVVETAVAAVNETDERSAVPRLYSSHQRFERPNGTTAL